MLNTSIGRLRLAGITEGISFILLLGVAMPLKYVWGKPEFVSVIGMAHGLLFLAFCLALFLATVEHSWPIKKAAVFFVAALLPFGPFVIDGRLKAEDAEDQRAAGQGG